MDAIFQLAAVYSVVDKLTGPVRKMADNVSSFEKMMNTSQGLTNYGMKIGALAGVMSESGEKMKGMMMGLIEPYAKIEDESAKLRTVIITTQGDVDASMKQTQQAAIEWSKTHTDAADKFIQTSYMMASAGLNDVQAIEATKTAMTVAKATMGDSSDAAALIATLYNNMGDKAKDAGTEMQCLGDVLTKTQQTFQFKNLDQLSEGLKYATPTALQFKMSVEEVNTVIGQLNNAGVTGGMAGTAFAATMRQMNKASAELGFEIARTTDGGVNFIGTLENIKAKYGNFSEMTAAQQEAFKKAFGDEGLRAISLLTDKTGDMNKALQDIAGSAGAAATAQKTMEDTVHARAIIAANRLTALKAAFGEKILGNKKVVEEVIPKFQKLVESLGDMVLGFAEAHPQITAAGLGMFALGTAILLLVAPILSVVSAMLMLGGSAVGGIAKMINGFRSVSTYLAGANLSAKMQALGSAMTRAFAMGQAGAVRCAAAMRTVAVAIGRTAQAAVVAAAQGIRNMTVALAGMARQAIMTAISALPPLIAAVWSFTAALLANPITWIVLAVVALGAALYYVVKHWNEFSTATKLVIAYMFPLGAAIAYVANNWQEISAKCQAAWQLAVAAVSNAINWIRAQINSGINWISGMANTFFTSGAALWDAFTNGIKSTISGPVDAVRSGLQQIREMLPFSDAHTGPLSQLTHNGRKLMTTIASGVTDAAPMLNKAVEDGLGGSWMQSLQQKMKKADFQMPVFQSKDGKGKSLFGDSHINLGGIFGGQGRKGSTVPGDSKTYHFHLAAGAVVIKAEKVGSADDVLAVFKQLATEAGAE